MFLRLLPRNRLHQADIGQDEDFLGLHCVLDRCGEPGSLRRRRPPPFAGAPLSDSRGIRQQHFLCEKYICKSIPVRYSIARRRHFFVTGLSRNSAQQAARVPAFLESFASLPSGLHLSFQFGFDDLRRPAIDFGEATDLLESTNSTLNTYIQMNKTCRCWSILMFVMRCYAQ